MALTQSALGLRIAEARTRAGQTQAELAAAASIDRSALAKIETGQRGVSAVELAAFATHLGSRIEWFLEDAPSSLVSHRTRLGSDSLTTSIDESIESLARNVEFVASFDQALLGSVIDPVERPQNAQEAEQMASRARREMHLDADSPVTNLVDRAAEIGLLAFSTPLSADTADAGTILLARGAVAVINSESKVGRRRISLAHEIGHYLLADDYTIDWRVGEHASTQRTESLIERFARSLLLPATGISSYWREGVDREGARVAALRTASLYRVDMSTLARRLLELGVVSEAAANDIRLTRTTKADIVELDLYVPHDLEGVTLPTRFQRSVLSLYRSEVINADRALDLLMGTFDESGLPELPPVSEQEIWKFTS